MTSPEKWFRRYGSRNHFSHVVTNVLLNEKLAFPVGLRSDFGWDVPVGAAVQLGGTVVNIEVIDSRLGNGKDRGFTASWRAGNHDHPSPHSESPRMSAGRSLRTRRPCTSIIPCSCNRLTASWARSRAFRSSCRRNSFISASSFTSTLAQVKSRVLVLISPL